jgi:hypothetical protein
MKHVFTAFVAGLLFSGCASSTQVDAEQELRKHDGTLDELEQAKQQNPATRELTFPSGDPSRGRR